MFELADYCVGWLTDDLVRVLCGSPLTRAAEASGQGAKRSEGNASGRCPEGSRASHDGTNASTVSWSKHAAAAASGILGHDEGN
jgi:hypothetical protein